MHFSTENTVENIKNLKNENDRIIKSRVFCSQVSFSLQSYKGLQITQNLTCIKHVDLHLASFRLHFSDFNVLFFQKKLVAVYF